MRIRITYIALLLFMFVAAKANPVSERQAREVGFKFLNATQNMNVKDEDALHLVKTYRCATGEAAFYVFNTSTGYVIVSADDCATPILGYSYEGPFDADNIPIQMQDCLNGFLEQIEYVVMHHCVAGDATAAQWERVRTTGRIKSERNDYEVLPLLKEQWGQGCGYNAYCPEDPDGSCGHAVTGCVATAMAQIMHYWKYPERGQGTHSYIPSTHPEYGEQSVDFSATTYDWANMPNKLNANAGETEINAVSTLMYHCGVSVEMMYGPDGSSAYSQNVGSALRNYFKYDNELVGKYKDDNNDAWIAQLKACLDLYRPIYYSGSSASGASAHAFVCDGYDRDDMLHFNWGWDGGGGYFVLGSTEMMFVSYNYAIFNIHPPYDPNHACEISVSMNPSNGGMVTGGGTLHCGDICTLTAHPFEGCKFQAWKEDDIILSPDTVYSFLVMENHNIVACFEVWSGQVDVTCVEDSLQVQSAVVSWANGAQGGGNISDPWPLINSFPSNSSGQSGVFTDGNYIYTTTWSPVWDNRLFFKCDLSGRFIEAFNVEGCDMLYDLAYDGSYVYGSYEDSKLYCIDLDSRTLVDVFQTECVQINGCTYDPDYDGFWICDEINYWYKKLRLIDREGHIVQEGPRVDSCAGIAYYRHPDGEPHLFLFCRDKSGENAKVHDYNITTGVVGHDVLCDFTQSPVFATFRAAGAYVGEYEGKAAFFGYVHTECIAIFELPLDVSDVRYHRVYRVNGTVSDEGALSNLEPIADRCYGSSYIDHAWDTLPSGTYTYGVSIMRGNEESRISWSAPIEHKQYFSVFASVDNVNGGTVSGQGRYMEGTICTLTATPAPRYSFVKWMKNGSAVSMDPVLNITVTGDAEYIACFEKTVFEINVYTQPASSGIVSGFGTYNKGETVTLKVTPNANYKFLKWTENGTFLSSETTYSFVAEADRTICANLVNNHGIDEQGQEVFSLRPNPAYDHLVVECSQPVCRCEIYSITGTLVRAMDEINEMSVDIDVDDLSSGLYLIRITTEGYSLTEKFIKQ